jgi:TonB-dependent receptor-like protein
MQWRVFTLSSWMVGISLVCAGQVSNTDLADSSLEQLGNVKVYSASRHLQSVGDAPSSVTVITSEDIQRYGYRTLADILKTVRGFFVTYDRNYSSVGVRGFARPGDYNTRVLLLVDGHRLNDNVYDEAMLGTEFPIDPPTQNVMETFHNRPMATAYPLSFPALGSPITRSTLHSFLPPYRLFMARCKRS